MTTLDCNYHRIHFVFAYLSIPLGFKNKRLVLTRKQQSCNCPILRLSQHQSEYDKGVIQQDLYKLIPFSLDIFSLPSKRFQGSSCFVPPNKKAYVGGQDILRFNIGKKSSSSPVQLYTDNYCYLIAYFQLVLLVISDFVSQLI